MSSFLTSGVAAGFPKLSSYLKKLSFGFDSEDLQERLQNVERVGREGLSFAYSLGESTYTYSMHELGDDLWAVFVTLRREAMLLGLSGKCGWENEWRRALTYGYWSLVMQMDARLESIERNAISGGENWGAPAIEWFGGIAGDCLALGWNDYARDLASRSRWMESKRGFPDALEGFQRTTQRFVLRLAEGMDGAIGVPEFDAVLATWRSAPAADLAPLLLAMCDRHTHQCKSTDTDMEFDLPFRAFWYDPYEVLAVLRLRASAGVDNPRIDHPLMETALGQLQQSSAAVLDGGLAAAVSRIKDWPSGKGL